MKRSHGFSLGPNGGTGGGEASKNQGERRNHFSRVRRFWGRMVAIARRRRKGWVKEKDWGRSFLRICKVQDEPERAAEKELQEGLELRRERIIPTINNSHGRSQSYPKNYGAREHCYRTLKDQWFQSQERKERDQKNEECHALRGMFV